MRSLQRYQWDWLFGYVIPAIVFMLIAFLISISMMSEF